MFSNSCFINSFIVSIINVYVHVILADRKYYFIISFLHLLLNHYLWKQYKLRFKYISYTQHINVCHLKKSMSRALHFSDIRISAVGSTSGKFQRPFQIEMHLQKWPLVIGGGRGRRYRGPLRRSWEEARVETVIE